MFLILPKLSTAWDSTRTRQEKLTEMREWDLAFYVQVTLKVAIGNLPKGSRKCPDIQ